MVYCEQCGAANDIMNQQCHRCGFQFVPLEPLPGERVHAAVTNTVPSNLNSIPDMESAAGIGAGLELPEWLQRAAAETPESPAESIPVTPEFPPASVFPPTPEAVLHPQQGNVIQPAQQFAAPHNVGQPRVEPQRQATPPPSAGHSSTMPEWLKTGQPPILRQSQADSTDTTSFISEGDLPEWIRQIGAADTAKRVEEERIAAELARATEEVAPTRNILPGEANANGSASNPWLTRKEGATATGAWAGSAATPRPRPVETVAPFDDNERPEVIQINPDSTPSATKNKSKLSIPSIKMPSVPKPAMPKVPVSSESGEAANPMLRYGLIGAIALLLIVLLVFVVL